jgi:tRNA(Ile2) C34 agmatinyltransferase TiaS
MASPAAESHHTVVCPHCHKQFEAEPLDASASGGPGGFKCPHCRLFVPADRAERPH